MTARNTPRTRARRWLRRIAIALTVVLAIPALLFLSLFTPPGRTALCALINRQLATMYRGSLRLERITELHWNGPIRGTGVTLRDPQGRVIITDGQIEIDSTRQLVAAVVRGLRHQPGAFVPTVRLHLATVRLIPGATAAPSIADAFAPHDAPPTPHGPPPPGAPFLVRHIELTVDRLENTLGGIDATASGLRAEGGAVTEPVALVVRTAQAQMFSARSGAVAVRATFDWQSHNVYPPPAYQPVDLGTMRATVDAAGDDARCHAEYEKTGTRERVSVTDCHVGATALDRAAGKPVGITADIASASAEHEGTAPWTIRAAGALNAQRFEANATLQGSDAAGDLTVDHLDLARLLPTLPRSEITGTLHAERHGEDLAVDTTRLRARVNGGEIPSVRAQATLQGRHLVVRDLVAPALDLRAHGEVDLDHPMDGARAEVTLRARDAARIPFAPPGTRGQVDLDAHAETQGGRIIAHATASARDLHASGAQLSRANATMDLTVADNVPHVRADVRAEGVRAAGYGPLAVNARAEGDPTRAIDGEVHATGVAPSAPGQPGNVRLDAPVLVRIENGTTRVHIPRAALAVRGATGTVDADVTLARGGAAPSVRAHLNADNAGTADVTLQGGQLRARFHQFSAAWVSRVVATPVPLAGTLEGDLALPARGSEIPTGTLRWDHARLPYLGDFDLAVRTEHQGGALSLDAMMTLAPGNSAANTTLHAVARAVPPANAADVTGWVRGLRDARIDVARADLARLDAVLPAGYRARGRADARIVARREDPGAPLRVVLALDARQTVVSRMISTAETPLAVPLRLRGAACATLRGTDFAHPDLATDLALGRESDAADEALPEACGAPADTARPALVPDPLLQVRSDARGPWVLAATEFAAEARRARSLATLQISPRTRGLLARALADARVELGPITTEHWPFTPAARSVSALLAPPRQPLEATLVLTGQGNLASPTLTLDARARGWNVPGLVGSNDVVATISTRITPGSPGDFLLDRAAVTADARAVLRDTSGAAPREDGAATARVDLLGRVPAMLDPRGALTSLERRHVQIDASSVDLSRFEWARTHDVQGRVSLHARDGESPAVLLLADLAASELRVHGAPAAGALLSARVESDGGAWVLRSCAGIDPSAGEPARCSLDETAPRAAPGSLRLFASVPLLGTLPALRPDVHHARASLAADHVRLEPISALTEALAQTGVGGELSARLDWDAAQPRGAHGELHLSHGVIDVADVGIPAREVTLDLTDDGQHVRIDRLSLRAGQGTLEGGGTAEIHAEGNSIATAQLHLAADRLLVAQAGNNYGALTAHADATIDARVDGTSATLRVHDARLQMPQQPTHDVTALAPDPHVVVVGREPASARGGGPATGPAGYAWDLDLAVDNPVVVTRNDFFVVARPRIHLHQDNHGQTLAGAVYLTLTQSWFEALGKRFYFDRAAVRFDGGLNRDPVLDVAAHYDSTSAGRIVVTVSGPLSSPDIHFSAENYPEADQSQVLAMLVLGRQDSEGAGDQQSVASQATSAIAGIAAGFGVNWITTALGEHSSFVPRLIVEPGSGLGAGRYGVGVTEMNGRLYVEGTYGTQQGYGGALEPAAAQTGDAVQEFRGLVEYTLSSRWSVRGQYGTSNRFGLDVFWVPVR